MIPGNNSVEEKLINVADVYDFMISQKWGKTLLKSRNGVQWIFSVNENKQNKLHHILNDDDDEDDDNDLYTRNPFTMSKILYDDNIN